MVDGLARAVRPAGRSNPCWRVLIGEYIMRETRTGAGSPLAPGAMGRPMQLTRDAAWALLTEYTQNENLRKHAIAVEAAVRGYARLYGEDEEAWGVTALLHDFDYDKYPDLADHPFRGAEILRERGYPDWLVRAVLSHADHTGVARETRLEHVLFACDEMAGFVTAAALVRPSKSLLDLEAGSVVKRMKEKAFARAVNRDDLRKGAEEIGLPLADHAANVIAFMREKADELGLRGSL
jgi:putative nucleotidyltransferase with HDIG domain